MNRVESIKYFRATMALLRNEGFFGGVYKGMLALLLRDVPGWGVYFWSYEFLKRQFGMDQAKRNGTDNTKLNIMIKMWCAGVAGQCSWFVSYPMDIVKTQIQCTADRRVPMREVIMRIHQTEGVQGFFKGFSPTLTRSFIVNAVALPAYEYLNDRYCYGTVNGRRTLSD